MFLVVLVEVFVQYVVKSAISLHKCIDVSFLLQELGDYDD